MIKIGVHAANPDDSCSYYRSWGPFGKLRQLAPYIEVQPIATSGWSEVSKSDIIFLQRPFDKSQLAPIKTANQWNIPVWVDYDDDFTNIPRDNPNWSTFNDPATQKIFQECCQRASVVTVTTEALKEALKDLNKNILVIPNVHNDYVLGPCTPTGKRAQVIAWRGSNTHQNDLLQYRDEIKALATEFPDFEWHFFGYYPFFLTEKMKHQFHRMTGIMSFFQSFKAISPAISIVPLADNPFNRSKSSIAWLESTYVGSMTVAPDFDGWKQPGVFNYSDRETFHQQMRKAIASVTGEVNEPTLKSAEYIRNSLSLSKMNTIRLALIQALLGRGIEESQSRSSSPPAGVHSYTHPAC
jgi:hypothetical protein